MVVADVTPNRTPIARTTIDEGEPPSDALLRAAERAHAGLEEPTGH